ncbi:Uncharacterised protein [Mycobacteroides abscessus subsp. abscessus]|nr:Uncharacterised protein [Mycobacteroides abscessus subsp. abscessus]
MTVWKATRPSLSARLVPSLCSSESRMALAMRWPTVMMAAASSGFRSVRSWA